MKYKGYHGQVNYDEDAKLFHGEIVGLRDVITFQGTNPDEIETAFRESIDDYLDFCKERGEEPDKPYSGRFNVRIPELIHRHIAELAKIENESLNTIVLRSLIEFLAIEKVRYEKVGMMIGLDPKSQAHEKQIGRD